MRPLQALCFLSHASAVIAAFLATATPPRRRECHLAPHKTVRTVASLRRSARTSGRECAAAAAHRRRDRSIFRAVASSNGDDTSIQLADDGAVRKTVLEEGTGEVPQQGEEVKVEYVGTLVGERYWTVDDVVECWLKAQQGMDGFDGAFRAAGVNGEKLMDGDAFTEDFVATELGISNKISCKKLVMAARRLAKQQTEFSVGTEFDSSAERGPFKFTLGGGKAIKAMEIAVARMTYGEKARIVCRADYAYGGEGLRRGNGDVVVPPFATLCFEAKLLER